MSAQPSIPNADRENFGALYSSAHLPLLRYVLTLLPDRHLADDVVQETARLLWRKFDHYDPTKPFLPWARQFAYFEVLKARRRLVVNQQCFSDSLIERFAHEQPAQEPELERRRELLEHCLQKLDSPSRELLAARYESKAALHTLAEKLGKTANAIYLALHRVRQTLMNCVDRAMAREDCP